MNILHIVSVDNDMCSGVCVVVPQHIQAQQQLEDVAVINLTNLPIQGAIRQFEYKRPFSIISLPEPFSTPDLVVFHEIYKYDYVDISKQLRNKEIPYIIIPHGSLTKEAQRKKWLKKLTANFIFFNSFINGATAIQFLSEKEKEQSPFGKIKFIGTNGINMPVLQKESFSYGNVKLLYIGAMLWRIKGLDLMLTATGKCASELRKNGVTLDLYGPFSQDKKLEVRRFLEAEDVSDFVYLNDAITGDEKVRKLLECDIFIQTSRSEGMSMGVLEALNYGIPCLVTEGTNMGEMIRKYDAGWVAETDVDAISFRIQQAISERHLWREKSINARRLIDENFRWEHVVGRTVVEYKEIINNKEN